MKKTLAILAVAGLGSSASAGFADLLIVDLQTPNEVTITATSGASAATVTGLDFVGLLLADFYTAGNDTGGSVTDLAGSGGDLAPFLNSSDGSPDIFRSTFPAPNAGLNIWSMAGVDNEYVAGTQALSGSVTFLLDADDYADMVNSVSAGDSGRIFVPADSDDDIADATAIGNWRVIPAPGAGALLALAGVAGVRRRRN
jgi:hypothetical protein